MLSRAVFIQARIESSIGLHWTHKGMHVEALPILYSVLLWTNTLSSDTKENKGASVCEAITSTPERVQKANLKVNASESSFVVFNFSYLIPEESYL